MRSTTKKQCTNCHAVVPVQDKNDPQDKRKSIFKPIGPKARFLNYDYDQSSQVENQLAHWESEGILTSVPTDKAAINSAPIFKDTNDGRHKMPELGRASIHKEGSSLSRLG